jgi:hypothetical protein
LTKRLIASAPRGGRSELVSLQELLAAGERQVVDLIDGGLPEAAVRGLHLAITKQSAAQEHGTKRTTPCR